GKPLAITNCLNFGNPEKPDVMWQFAEAVRGIGDACRDLETPVTGGNVSFYNETNENAIYPTPVIGMLGVLGPPERSVGLAFGRDGDEILLAGETRPGDFAGSEYSKVMNGIVAGRPPRLDMGAEKALQSFLIAAAEDALPASAHDVSAGGTAVALSESAIAGGLGFSVEMSGADPHRWLFSESPSRAVLSCSSERTERVIELAARHGVPVARIGTVGGSRLDFGTFGVELQDARDTFESALPNRLSATMT
ncbi:MAG: AIR synthase-related protein, partial [Actinomycetota bacterium]